MFRIVIADHDESMRRRLVSALLVEDGLEVVGSAGDVSTALDLVSRRRPNLVLVALAMPRDGETDLVQALTDAHPHTIVVVRQGEAGNSAVREAFASGAGGFLLEEGFDESIASCIRFVTPGELPTTGDERRAQSSGSAARAIPAPGVHLPARPSSTEETSIRCSHHGLSHPRSASPCQGVAHRHLVQQHRSREAGITCPQARAAGPHPRRR